MLSQQSRIGEKEYKMSNLNKTFNISPAGARKSIVHPNETDIKVFEAMLTFTASPETPKLQMDWISTVSGIDKSEVQKSIKWLSSANKIETVNRGRGTHYNVTSTIDDLHVVDASGDNYRKTGGPTVKQIVRAVFNGLEPARRVAPAEVNQIAQKMYPDSNLTRQSFGQVFTNMAKEGHLQFEGEGRSRKYWRGMELLEDAAPSPDNFDFDQFFNSSDSTDSSNDDSVEDTIVIEYNEKDFADIEEDTSLAV